MLSDDGRYYPQDVPRRRQRHGQCPGKVGAAFRMGCRWSGTSEHAARLPDVPEVGHL